MEGKSKMAKGEDSKDEGDNAGTICYVKVKGANAKEQENHFECDTGTTHQTTNRLDLLQEVQNSDMTVEAHDKSTFTYHKNGTHVFVHNGKTHRLQNSLHDPSYGNPISGQRNDTYTLESGNENARLLVQGKEIYKMKVDAKGAL